MRRLISILLITAGILVALYPLYNRAHTWYWQQRLLAAWEEEEVQEEYCNLADTLAVGEGEGEGEELEAPSWEELPLLGVLTIEEIDARLPILPDVSEEYLRIGVGHLPGTALPGEGGNCLLSAHRSHTYGRLFNRLDEVKVGDTIIIETKEGEYTYRVTSTYVVEPDDMSVLDYEEGEQLITLVTCHPLYVASHRLIVRGKLQQ